MPAKENHNTELFKNHKMIEFLIEQSSIKLTDDEKNLLFTNAALAERIFSTGLKDAVRSGKTSVAELSKLSPEAMTILTYGLTKNALNEGVIKASQVGALSKDQLAEFTDLIQSGNFSKSPAGDKNLNRVAELLGLDEGKTAALRKSFDKTEHDYQQKIPHIAPSPDYSIPKLETPPPSPKKSI